MLGCATAVNKKGESPMYLATFSLDDSTTVDVLVSLRQDDLVFMNGKERIKKKLHIILPEKTLIPYFLQVFLKMINFV